MMLEYITWNVNKEIISIGPLVLRWYGVLFASGFAISYILLQNIFNQEGEPETTSDKLTMYMVISTILGARLGHCLFYETDYYLSNPIEILKIWEGGLASHGAAIGILTALWLFTKSQKTRSYFWVLDRIAIMVPMAGCFIRLGNLMNSEIVGKVTDVSWGFKFIQLDGLNAPARHPTQLYEAIFYLILFFFLRNYYNKNVTKLKDGIIFGFFMTFLFSWRFIMEFFKAEQVDFERTMFLNMGQLLSIPLIIIGLIVLYKQSKSKEINYIVHK